MKNNYLVANWKNLLMFNYIVDPKLLLPYVPQGVELDLYNGKCFVSLVGFWFNKTQLGNISVPIFGNFEEVNLRFYVKRVENGVEKRGVVFIKELVPFWIVAKLAQISYNEPYQSTQMGHRFHENMVGYSFKSKSQLNTMVIRHKGQPYCPEVNSEPEFITEHYWGYCRQKNNSTVEYEVTHPKWLVYEPHSHQVDCKFGELYGEEFKFLETQEPSSVFMCTGSDICVKKPKLII